jgi:hypothetical protein
MKKHICGISISFCFISAFLVIASNKPSSKSEIEASEKELTRIFLQHYNASKIIVRCKLANGKFVVTKIYKGSKLLSEVTYHNKVLQKRSHYPKEGKQTPTDWIFIFYTEHSAKSLIPEILAVFDSKINVGCGEMDISLLDNPKKVNAFVSKLLKDTRNKRNYRK